MSHYLTLLVVVLLSLPCSRCLRTAEFTEVSCEIQTLSLSLSAHNRQHVSSLSVSIKRLPHGSSLSFTRSHLYAIPMTAVSTWGSNHHVADDHVLRLWTVMRGFWWKKTNEISCVCRCYGEPAPMAPGRVGLSSACVLELRLRPEKGAPRADHSLTKTVT